MISPEERARRMRVQIEETLPRVIERSGWAVQVLPGTEQEPPFAYSIGAGVTVPGAPEVLVFAPQRELAGGFVNDILRRVREGTLRVAEGVRDLDLLAGDHPVAYRRVHDSHLGEYVGIGLRYHQYHHPGAPLPAYFMAVIADANRLMPWEAGYDARRNLPVPPLWRAAGEGDRAVPPRA